jgi:hypothetical protein
MSPIDNQIERQPDSGVSQTIQLDDRTLTPPQADATVIIPQPAPQAPAAPKIATTQPDERETWPPRCFAKEYASIAEIRRLGLPVSEALCGTIGGGIGGFAFADQLRIRGVPAEQIVVLGPNPSPYGHYSELTGNSQIPLHERIRSNSPSTPDNIWGWPGYALREIVRELRAANIGRAASLLWQILGEPSLTDTYTPRLGDVFKSIDREANRSALTHL